jgi:hypothetical protein
MATHEAMKSDAVLKAHGVCLRFDVMIVRGRRWPTEIWDLL